MMDDLREASSQGPSQHACYYDRPLDRSRPRQQQVAEQGEDGDYHSANDNSDKRISHLFFPFLHYVH